MKARFLLILTILGPLVPHSATAQNSQPKRDPQVAEILKRTIAAAGGDLVLAAVRNITESGEVKFYWGKSVSGPVTIRMTGGSRFRMDADLSEAKTSWIVRDAVGTKIQDSKNTPLTSENAVNLSSLTYPVGLVFAALKNTKNEFSFVGIEKRSGLSVYRIRLKGALGLTEVASPMNNVSKDLLIDALSFDIVGVEDHPYHAYAATGSFAGKAPRTIDFADFRSLSGVRMPFSISTGLQGQRTMSIQLTQVQLNTDIEEQVFDVQK